jgi:hypothetical protein
MKNLFDVFTLHPSHFQFFEILYSECQIEGKKLQAYRTNYVYIMIIIRTHTSDIGLY